MATIDEPTRLDRESAESESRALRNLGEHLREVVLDMPAESKLARHARALEAGRRAHEFWQVMRDIQEGRRADVGEAMAELAESLYPDDALRKPVEDLARILWKDD